MEAEYDRGSGFLGQLRTGNFDAASRDRLLNLLERMQFRDAGELDRRLVALLWYMPLIIEWQQPRLASNDRELAREAGNRVTAEVERILGVP